MQPLSVSRTNVRIGPNPERVIAKPFFPGDHVPPGAKSRAALIVSRILDIPEPEVVSTLEATQAQFSSRHLNFTAILERNFETVAHHVEHEISHARRLLIGAYFTQEYSIEAAALGNPSIVAAPDQSGLAPDEQRFIMSLRAIGEGHISSIEFRSGVVTAAGNVTLDELTPYVTTARHLPPVYEKQLFRTKLMELDSFNQVASFVLDAVPERFTLEELNGAIQKADEKAESRADLTTKRIHWLATSNYTSSFSKESAVSERVLFPNAPVESRGMEDARFVRFQGEDGAVTYYATYTAFDGSQILPQLIETPDFLSFSIATLNGAAAKNKGMALFPRKIDGHFTALSRHDNENIYLMRSDDVRFWDDTEKLQSPTRPWELIQLGNCGSPMETEAGWLVITHGVGPLRRYTLGAVLLDKEDPSRMLGHLKEPLLVPETDERDGYVPNVVYSCGSMIFGGNLILPYGFSDVGTRIATVPLDELLTRLTESTRS